MKMHGLLLALSITAAQGACAAALADEIELLVPNKAGMAPPNAIAEIKVDGDSQKYKTIKNKKLNYIVAVRGDRPKRATGGGALDIWLGDAEVDATISTSWAYHEISASYEHPLSDEFPELRVSPVDLCNTRLEQTSGKARKQFRKEGTTFAIQKAYPLVGSVEWWIKKPSGLSEPKGFGERTHAPVKITCMPLARHDPDPNAPSRTTPAPPPTRTTPPLPPLFTKTSFKIEPSKIVKDGKHLCPSELRLYGYVETSRAFEGRSIFMGPHYLSAITELDFSKAGSRNLVAGYPMKWHQLGGLAAQPNAKPADQKLAFRFNIQDQDGKVIETLEKTVTIGCRKITPNDAAVGGGMTVAPAN